MNAPVQIDAATEAYSTPLDQIDVSNPRLYQEDCYFPYFERLRREDPVHYRKGGMLGRFLVGHDIQGHHARRDAPRDLFLGGEAWRHQHHRPAGRIPPLEFHLDGPAAAR